MGDTLHKMQVIIEATTSPLKKEMENSRREVKKSVEEIQKETEKVKNPFKGMESKALQPVRNTLNKIREMLSRNPVKNFQIKAGIKVLTEEYQQLQEKTMKAQKLLDGLQEKKQKFEGSGKSKENQQWQSLAYDIEHAKKKLTEYKTAAAGMRKSGTAFEEKPTNEYLNIQNSIKAVNEQIRKYEAKGDKLEAAGVKKESKQWQNLKYDIDQAYTQLWEYEDKAKELEKSGKATKKAPTEEYKNLQKDILQVRQELERYQEKEEKLQTLGVSKESQEWKKLKNDIASAQRKVNEYQTEAAKMQKNNTDVKRPVSLPRQALNFGTGIFKGIRTIVSKGWGGFTKLLGGIGNIASSFSGVIRKCSGAYAALIQKFTSGIPFLNRTKSSFNGLGTSGRGLTGILKTIGMTAKFMFASFVIRGAVDGAKQGFQNLAQYSGETNRSLSLLMSSLTQLKNSLATAFAPILNVVAPILNSFIQTVINVVNSIGQLMGALTGKTTMVTAKKVNQDYAASLNSTSTGLKNNAKNADTASKAAKQYQRTLLGFDQINKLNDDSDSSGSGGAGSGTDTSPLGGVNDMFQTTAIKSRFKDLAKLIKDSWKSGDFTELGAMVGNKLNEALERIPWGKIQNTCNKIAKSIATFLNGFIEAADWKLVGNTFSKGLNTAFGFVDTFAKNFHWNSLGKAIRDGINGALEGLDWNLIKGTVHDTVFGLVSTLNTAIATTNWIVVGKTVGECFNTRLEALYTTVHNFNWRDLGTALADLVTNTVKTIDTGKIGQTLSDGIKGFFDFAISAIEHMDWWSMGDTIYNKAKDLMVNIDWSGIADRVFETIGAAFGGFAAFIGGIFKNAVADARKYIIKHFTEAGKFTWEGFKNGVVQSFKDIGTWIKAHIFKPFINGFKKAFGIHSPSTVMRTQGGYVISGLFNGMKAGLPAVLSWIAKIPGQTKERLGNAKTWLRGKGNAAIIGLKNGWEAVRESTFLSRVKKISSQSFNAIGDIKSKVTPKGRDIISGMRTGLNNNWSSLSGILSNIPGKVANAIPSLYTVGQNVIQTFANGFSSIHIPMPHIGWDWEGGSIKIGNFKFSLPRFNLSWYANGGFPGMGEMFVARESGPELVGRMGNRSAVANNNQIIAGIRAGVFEAVVNAFESMQGRNDRGQELHIYLEGDAKKLFKVIRQEGNNYQKQTGNPVFG